VSTSLQGEGLVAMRSKQAFQYLFEITTTQVGSGVV